jgi:hypothetical protein
VIKVVKSIDELSEHEIEWLPDGADKTTFPISMCNYCSDYLKEVCMPLFILHYPCIPFQGNIPPLVAKNDLQVDPVPECMENLGLIERQMIQITRTFQVGLLLLCNCS